MKNLNVKLFANTNAAANTNAGAGGSTIAPPGLRPGELKIVCKILKNVSSKLLILINKTKYGNSAAPG